MHGYGKLKFRVSFFSGQFDAGSDNSSVTEKLKGSRRSPIVLSELDEHEEFAESGNWGMKFVDIGGRDGASKIARSPQFSTLAFSGRLVKENDGSASRGLSLTNSSGIGLL